MSACVRAGLCVSAVVLFLLLLATHPTAMQLRCPLLCAGAVGCQGAMILEAAQEKGAGLERHLQTMLLDEEEFNAELSEEGFDGGDA